MSSNIGEYLRAQRLAWDLSQEDLGTLLLSGRKRVANVELGRTEPNAGEILAYSLVFGVSTTDLLSGLVEEAQERVMRGAYALNQRLDGQTSRRAGRRRELTEFIRERLVASVNSREI